jgi:hypothetical protein
MVHTLFMDLRRAYGSVRREVLCNTLIEIRVTTKLVRLTKIC